MDVKARFLKYVSFDTRSDENSTSIPSAAKERLLGEYLVEDLLSIGVENARIDEYGYVYGEIEANTDEVLPAIGFIGHMDTSPAVTGENVNPKTVVFDGTPIALNDEFSINPNDFPSLNKYMGQELIVTDGTTLLGADDKAGVAEIFTAAAEIIADPEFKHGKIYIGITPDEEIGRGADYFNLDNFKADYGYTVDGGSIGELEYENFNAASAFVEIKGFNIHPGEAKGKMRNAILYANEFIYSLPEDETPAKTEKYEGFYHIQEIRGNESEAFIKMIIRDHDRIKFEEKKANILNIAKTLNEKYGEGTVSARVKDSYYNMKEKIEPVMFIVDKAKQAMEDAGVTPTVVPIRGGTDGARLSYEGLPCPNLSTGGENFHSKFEYIPVEALEKMVKVIKNLCRA